MGQLIYWMLSVLSFLTFWTLHAMLIVYWREDGLIWSP